MLTKAVSRHFKNERIFMKFIYVTGPDDFGAVSFSEKYGNQLQDACDKLEKGETLLDDDGTEFECEVIEFGDIDSEFISFVRNNLMDYDYSKNVDIFQIDDTSNK